MLNERGAVAQRRPNEPPHNPPSDPLTNRTNRNRLAPATAALAAACLCAAAFAADPAPFQRSGAGYYVTGDHTLRADVSGCDVLVGRNADGTTSPGTATLTVARGATVTDSTPDAAGFGGLTTFGNSRTRITSGTVTYAKDFDTSRTTISGGNVTYALGSGASVTTITDGTVGYVFDADASTATISGGNVYSVGSHNSNVTVITSRTVDALISSDAATATISGGSVAFATARDATKTTVAGGTVDHAQASGTAAVTIRGGTFTNGLMLEGSATADFVGSGLRCAYKGHGSDNPYNVESDRFAVSGTFGGAHPVFKSCDVYLASEGAANTAPRRFTLNGAPPNAAAVAR